MNEREYNELPGIRSSQIKALAIGGPRALWEMTFGEIAETASMRLGSLAHALAENPERTDWAVAQFDGRTKEGKAERADFAARGVKIVSRNEWDAAMHIASDFRRITDGAEREIPLSSDINGVPIKCRLDALNGETLSDLKSTSDVDLAEHDFWSRRYDLQLGFYSAICEQNGRRISSAICHFAETKSPWRTIDICLFGDALTDAKNEAMPYAKMAAALIKAHGENLEAWPQPDAVFTMRPAWLARPHWLA